jgi:hypothetical protein
VVGDTPTRMLRKAQEDNLICGLVPHLILAGLAILQYADDTIILEMIINVNPSLYL